MNTKYHMRRNDKQISATEDMLSILAKGRFTSIAMCRDSEPYLVTLSYGLDREEKALYCHCAHEGLKMEFLKSNPGICGTVIEDMGYRMGQCEQGYRSLVYRGKMSVVCDVEEKKHGLGVLLDQLEDEPSLLKSKYLSNLETLGKVCILKITISEMTGKEDV